MRDSQPALSLTCSEDDSNNDQQRDNAERKEWEIGPEEKAADKEACEKGKHEIRRTGLCWLDCDCYKTFGNTRWQHYCRDVPKSKCSTENDEKAAIDSPPHPA